MTETPGTGADEQPSYQNAPAYRDEPAAVAAPTAPPPPLALAVKLMWAGAVLSVIGILVSFLTTDAARQSLEDRGSLTSDEIDTAVTVGIAFGVIFGLIGVALWIVNAIFNGRGKKWARILGTVLGGLSVLSLLSLFAQSVGAVTVVLSLVQVALAIVIVVLIWRPESSRFYDAMSAR